ncbi:MAG: rhomboid family intramembrane serine protease [Actinomycetota bacterium]
MDHESHGGTEVADGVRHCYRHPQRETLLACSNCERPICTSCAQQAAVGLRCPDCAGGGPRRIQAPRLVARGDTAVATVALIAVNVVVFLAEMSQGIGVRGIGGSQIIRDGAVAGPLVADGEWWRLVTSGFIHAGLGHIAFNMLALWWLGGALERYIGVWRLLAIYGAALLWGSAGAILLSPDNLTVGASGGVFGLMAALLVIERQRGMALLGSSIGVVLLLNLGITFAIPGISIGGHLGGLVGGGLAALVLSGFGRGHIAYGRVAAPMVVGLAAVLAGAVALSIAIA